MFRTAVSYPSNSAIKRKNSAFWRSGRVQQHSYQTGMPAATPCCAKPPYAVEMWAAATACSTPRPAAVAAAHILAPLAQMGRSLALDSVIETAAATRKRLHSERLSPAEVGRVRRCRSRHNVRQHVCSRSYEAASIALRAQQARRAARRHHFGCPLPPSTSTNWSHFSKFQGGAEPRNSFAPALHVSREGMRMQTMACCNTCLAIQPFLQISTHLCGGPNRGTRHCPRGGAAHSGWRSPPARPQLPGRDAPLHSTQKGHSAVRIPSPRTRGGVPGSICLRGTQPQQCNVVHLRVASPDCCQWWPSRVRPTSSSSAGPHAARPLQGRPQGAGSSQHSREGEVLVDLDSGATILCLSQKKRTCVRIPFTRGVRGTGRIVQA